MVRLSALYRTWSSSLSRVVAASSTLIPSPWSPLWLGCCPPRSLSGPVLSPWPRAALPPTGILYTVVPGEGASASGEVATTGPAAVPGALLEIGRVDQAKAIVDPQTASRAPQGSVVYILTP